MSTQLVETDLVITRTIAAVAASQGLSFTSVLMDSGIPRANASRRRNRGGWSAVEVARVATRLGVSVADLYSGMSGALRIPERAPNAAEGDAVTRSYPTLLTLPRTKTDLLYPMDVFKANIQRGVLNRPSVFVKPALKL